MPHLTSLARPGLPQAARPRADLSAPVPWGAAGVAAVLLAAAALAVAIALVADGSSGTGLGATIFQSCYQVLLGLAVALCFARAAASAEERTAWLAIGAGLASWFAGDVAFWFWEGSESFQGFAFLLFYPGAAVGVFLLVRATGWRPTEFTDLAIALAAVATLWAWLMWPHVVHEDQGGRVLELVYPIADLVLAVLGLALLQALGWRPALRWLLITTGFATIAVVDSLYLVGLAHDTWREGTLLDLLWPAGALAVAASAWIPVPPDADRATPTQSFPFALAVIAISFAVFLLVLDHWHKINAPALVLAATTFAIGIVRGVRMHVRQLRAERSLRTEATRVVQALAAAVDSKDRYTRSHSDNVAAGARRIGARLGLSEARLRRLEVAGQLHDVGKIAVPDAILLKSGPLDDEEFEVMKRHAAEGERIVRSIGLNDVAPWIRHHHERWDGRGYPDRLAGTAAPLEARILAAADALDAMTSTRSYHEALSAAGACREIAANAGSQFDPAIAEAVVELIGEGKLPVSQGR